MNYNTIQMKFKILTAPGFGGSEPQHWQSIWEKENPDYKRIEQRTWFQPVCSEWVQTIENEINNSHGNVVIIAHSLACIALMHLSIHSKYLIKGALLVAPPDVERYDFPKQIKGFAPIPLSKLPFKSILIASTNDQYTSIERAEQFAKAWGSEFVNIGNKGHINLASNLGSWEEGKIIFQKLFLEII